MSKAKKNKSGDQKVQLGKKVLYIGLFSARFTCNFCERHIKKGMVSEYAGKLFCNEDCIKMSLVLNEVQK